PLPADQIEAFARGHRLAGRMQFTMYNKILAEAHYKESERLFLLLGPECKVDLAMARVIMLSLYETIAKEPIQIRQKYDEVLRLLQETGDQWETALWIQGMG